MRQFVRKVWTEPLYAAVLLGALTFPATVARFMAVYSRDRPVNDDLQHSAPIAIEAMAGTLSWSDMLRLGDNIHPIFFSNVITVLSTWLTRWDTRFDAWVVFALYGVMLFLAVGLIWRARPAAGWVALVPLAALVFSLQKDFGYVVGVLFLWGQLNIIVLAALWVLWGERVSAAKLALLAGLTAAAGLATVSGVIAGLVLFPAVVLLGYRKPWMIGAWAVLCLLNIWSYMARPGLDVAANSANADFSIGKLLADAPGYAQFALVVLGRAFAYDNVTLAIWAGAIGVGLLLVNALWLLRQGESRAVIVFGTLAVYGLGSTLMISLGRLDKFGLVSATAPWYMDIALLFWIGVVGLIALTVTHSAATTTKRTLSALNVALLTVSLPFYAYATSQLIAFRDGATVGLDIQEACLFALPRTGDTSCLIGTLVRPDVTNDLAVYGLTMFADGHYTDVLPQPQTSTWVETASPWYNAALWRLFLPDVRESDRVNVVPANQPHDLTYSREPALSYSESLPDDPGADTVWHLRQDNLTTDNPWAGGFAVLARTPITFAGERFTMTGYQRFPDAEGDTPDLTFDALALTRWHIPVALTVPAGATIPLRSYWTRDDAPAVDYRVTFVLAGADGLGIARDDGPFGVLPTAWDADTVYADRREIKIPADTPPGSYNLLLGVYDPDTLESVGGLRFLTTVIVTG